jgi:hypothetical protein
MKIILISLSSLLLLVGGGYVWHMHRPISFFSGDGETEMPTLIDRGGVEDSLLASDQDPQGEKAYEVRDEIIDNLDQNGEVDDEFSIEIIAGENPDLGS